MPGQLAVAELTIHDLQTKFEMNEKQTIDLYRRWRSVQLRDAMATTRGNNGQGRRHQSRQAVTGLFERSGEGAAVIESSKGIDR